MEPPTIDNAQREGRPRAARAALAACGLLVGAWTVFGQPLPGTAPLEEQGDLAVRMVEGIDRYLMRGLGGARARRDAYWRTASAAEHRRTLARIIGAVDSRIPFEAPWPAATVNRPAVVASGDGYEVQAIRWPVFEGVEGDGLLLKPRGEVKARVIALPDADVTPEMLAGLAPGIAPERQVARRLAESGCLVVVPALIDRSDEFSGKEGVRFTNQPHREFIYRMAYEMGRHVIGYEAQKALALVDWFAREQAEAPIGVAGYGEGGLLALYSAALDERIGAAMVSGYLGPREGVWREPIYRGVWSQLETFGDAELARLVAPRTLVVDTAAAPAISGPPAEREGRRGAAPGAITTHGAADVREEADRARPSFPSGALTVTEGSASLEAFMRALKVQPAPSAAPLKDQRPGFDPRDRLRRQFQQLIDHTQKLVRQSEFTRAAFTSKLDTSSPEAWDRSAEQYRRALWEEVIGKMPPADRPLSPKSRRIYDTPAYSGYEVTLDVWPDVFAYGILLVPKDLKPGERRPVVVCQHGLEGRPQHLIDPPDERLGRIYARYAAALAEQGFVVYAPQNPYIGEEKFRVLLRKAHPQKLSLFSFILGQHERTLEWLGSLPFVDPERIGFYGLSYGGKTAMRVPSLLKRYALSICSADFNEWIRKITDVDHAFSYMYTVEYDMLEFNLGNTFNYAEMAALIAPRPFMVERGHRDGVGIDEWVAYEYARVRRLYADLKIPERTEIEFFDGPHEIHGVGTFEFLRRHLRWPAR
ncbi:MAG: dienelactone hydrolase family protein [Bryobacteraceae bacterium]|nr:dienelactone hydrolase family protein [Bryobacteraceae bacterium]